MLKKNKSEAFSDFSAKHVYFKQEWKETVNRIMTLLKNQYLKILAFFDRNNTSKLNKITNAYRKIVLLVHSDKYKESNTNTTFNHMFKSSFIDFSLTH